MVVRRRSLASDERPMTEIPIRDAIALSSPSKFGMSETGKLIR